MKPYFLPGILLLTVQLFVQSVSAQNAAPQTPEDRIQATQNVTGFNKSGLATPPTPSGFIVVNGNVFVVSGGRAVPLTQEMSFKVTPTGFVGFNGMPQNIPNGSMLSMDGQLMAAPTGLVDGVGNALVLPAFSAQTAGLNGGITPTTNAGTLAPGNTAQGTNANQGNNATNPSAANPQPPTANPGSQNIQTPQQPGRATGGNPLNPTTPNPPNASGGSNGTNTNSPPANGPPQGNPGSAAGGPKK